MKRKPHGARSDKFVGWSGTVMLKRTRNSHTRIDRSVSCYAVVSGNVVKLTFPVVDGDFPNVEEFR